MIKRTFVALVATTMMLTVTHHITAQQATLVSNTTVAPEETWTLLGTRTVDFSSDSVVIVVADSATHFTSLKLTVLNGPLDMDKATVQFTDGETTDVDLTSDRKADMILSKKEHTHKESTESGKEYAKKENAGTEKEKNTNKGDQVFELVDNDKSIEKVTFYYGSKNENKFDNKNEKWNENRNESNAGTQSVVELWGNSTSTYKK